MPDCPRHSPRTRGAADAAGPRRDAPRLATVADIDGMHRVRLAVRENRLSDPGRITAADYRAALETLGRGWVIEAQGEIVTEYYVRQGWDAESGLPRPETLTALGLDQYAKAREMVIV